MAFLEKYEIAPRYLTAPSKRRSGHHITPSVQFIVAHDTGNPGATAAQNVDFYERSKDEESASAHLFVDDREILECIPALSLPPNQAEKAWHVLYSLSTDDKLFGHNANDAAIGVEYCFGGAIDADEAYRRYVWVLAALCDRFGLDPSTRIVGHFFLDPARRTDPVTGLARSRRTYEQLLRDVAQEFGDCGGKLPAPPANTGKVQAAVRLNLRNAPSMRGALLQTVPAGTPLSYQRAVSGDPVNGNATWYLDSQGRYFWSGGVVSI